MFSDHCPGHGRRVLLGPDDILTVRNDPDGVRVDWRCPCGGRGSQLTGRRRATPSNRLQTVARQAPGRDVEQLTGRPAAAGGD